MKSIISYVKYSASSVFAGKFFYFLGLAVVLFLVVVLFFVANNDEAPTAENVYYFLLIPGVLLIFYPAAYVVQSDSDARMLETLFGIPDYRFKVWLVRMAVREAAIGSFLFILALMCWILLGDFNVLGMTFHLMFPVVFLGGFGFMVATVARSGNSTAVVLVVVIMFFWLAGGVVEGSSWNLFHNPYKTGDVSAMMYWAEVTLYNRIYLAVGALLSVMFGMLRLQKRELFI